jgi:hypothetical protein
MPESQPPDRPDPDKLLRLVEREEAKARLKVYLGMAAGVGKTVRMLEDAHAMRRAGVDVVLGLIEPHGRAETIGQRPVRGGDVFDVQALGPFVLSAADWGTLAAEQWINGRRTFANPRLGTLSFFATAGRSTSSAFMKRSHSSRARR